MHPVVFDLQAGDAGPFAFAGFQVDEIGTAVVVDTPQFIKFGVVAGSDDASFAQEGGRFGQNGAG